MGLFDRIKRVANANLNDMVSRAEDRKNARTVYPAGRLVQLRQGVAQAIATNKRTQQQYNQSQMKPTGGNAMPAGFAKVMRIWHAKRWSEEEFCRNCQYAKAIWTSKAVRLIPLSVA